MNPYAAHGTEGLSGVELVVALYDGIIRFLYRAISAVEAGDVTRRRAEVKRALDIVVHLQATLRMDVGGHPAEALSEFYASVFAQILQGSQAASRTKFEHAIDCVRNVRDAWREVAKDPAANPDSLSPAAFTGGLSAAESTSSGYRLESEAGSRWNA